MLRPTVLVALVLASSFCSFPAQRAASHDARFRAEAPPACELPTLDQHPSWLLWALPESADTVAFPLTGTVAPDTEPDEAHWLLDNAAALNLWLDEELGFTMGYGGQLLLDLECLTTAGDRVVAVTEFQVLRDARSDTLHGAVAQVIFGPGRVLTAWIEARTAADVHAVLAAIRAMEVRPRQ